MSPIFGGPLTPGGSEVVLDPSEVAVDRAEIHLNAGAINVGPEGPDWGDAQVEQYLAEAARGQLPVDFRVPNRTITIPLLLGAAGPASFDGARAQLMAKVALFQREGGWIRRSAGCYADITGATLKLPDKRTHLGVEADVVLTLEALPDFYGDEIQLADHVTTTDAELVFTETDIDGDYPGRVRIVVDEDDSEAQRALIWGFRSRYYSAAATDRLAYEAEALTPLDSAAIATAAGASGGASNNVVQHQSVGGNWTPVLSTEIAASGHMTHKGTYRVYARVLTTSDAPEQRLRLVWDVGDLAFPEENPAALIPGSVEFYIVPLGEVRLDAAPIGTHRWQGIIQAKADGSKDLAIDKVWLVPVAEGFGELLAPIVGDPGLAAYAARDEFNQSVGALTGKTLPVGGTWANVTGGDADDYTVATASTAQRTAVSDATAAPRLARAGAAAVWSTVAVQADVKGSAFPCGDMGVFARLVDISNYFAVVVGGTAATAQLTVRKVIGGVEDDFAVATLIPYGANATYTVRLLALADRWFAWYGPAGSSLGEPLLQGRDSDLAPGGALDDGGAGLYDRHVAANAVTRTYDNFAVWVPTLDAVLNPGQSAELRTDGMYREDVTGAAFGPVHARGALPRIPPSGIEARTVEVFLKASRGDLGQLPDDGIDDISARITYRPSWLFPRAT